MQRIIIALLILALFSCRSGPGALHGPGDGSWKDSILRRHLATVSQVPIYDTTNDDFRMLRAYGENDSVGLVKMETDFEERVDVDTRNRHYADSFTKQVPVNKLNCLEGYRFDYDGGLCPYKTSLTLVRYKDSIVLNALVYEMSWDGSRQYKMLSSYAMRLDSLHWVDFNERLDDADFWGLKPYNDKLGLDGHSLRIYGFKNATKWDKAKYSFVYRWLPESGIMNCFRWLIKVSNCKKGCATAD